MKLFSFLTGIVLFISIYGSAMATRYYVDFRDGNDIQNGRTTNTAWKHCPGDVNATGKPASVQLLPGDIVLFRGGVLYRGVVRIKHDGIPGKPVLYKGDGWGDSKAIIEGSDSLNVHWTQCKAASDCMGNPGFRNIYYSDMPDNFNFFSGFYEDNTFLWFAQSPNPSSRFNYDNINDFYSIPLGRHFTATGLTDTARFNQSDPQYWRCAYILAWHKPNITTAHPITSFDPATGTIQYTNLGGDGIYNDRNSFYALLNHPLLIDQPGEYCTDSVAKRIYLWPPHSDNPNDHKYSYKTRQTGIIYSGRKNVVIEGFEVRNFQMGIIADNGQTENIIIRNNIIRNLRSNNKYAIQMSGKNINVENNRVEDCIRAVGILAGGENLTVRGNYVKNTSRQGIWFMGVSRGTILENTVIDIRGTHSNGISAYERNENILIAGNKVLNSNIALTYHGNGQREPDLHLKLTIYNNYFENACHSWGSDAKSVTLINNVCRGGFFFFETDTLTTSINNVMMGGGVADLKRNNIYTGAGNQERRRAVQGLQSGEIDGSQKDINDIFKDLKQGDVHLKAGSPAIDAGINPIEYLPVKMFPEYDFYRDLYGNKRPKGKAWDIGVHEYDE